MKTKTKAALITLDDKVFMSIGHIHEHKEDSLEEIVPKMHFGVDDETGFVSLEVEKNTFKYFPVGQVKNITVTVEEVEG